LSSISAASSSFHGKAIQNIAANLGKTPAPGKAVERLGAHDERHANCDCPFPAEVGQVESLCWIYSLKKNT
jgi:hypothetical protein